MENSINYPNIQVPANYSGVTINITSPTVNALPPNSFCQPQIQLGTSTNTAENNNVQNSTTGKTVLNESPAVTPVQDAAQFPEKSDNKALPNSYPPQYYLNNYNYIQGNKEGAATLIPNNNIETQEDLSSSKEIINYLETRENEQKDLEKNGKKTRITALTNEYIMSLENYLNNPNTEIRLMASKEILTRLDEDKSRYDDAALNALLNKMLQDPEKLVRIAALSAFSSQLASGNEYTVKLLKDIQQNPNADKEDVLEASEILLKMTANTELKYTPIEPNGQQKGNEQ